MLTIIEKKIRALCDLDLRNEVCFRSLVEGEVATFFFKNKQEMEVLLKFGRIELVGLDVPESREILVVGPEDLNIPGENELLKHLALTGNLDKLEK